MSRNTKKVLPVEHIKWFLKILKSEENLLYISCMNNKKVGNVRFDKIHGPDGKNNYFISINLNPKFRGKQLSRTILLNSIHEFTKDTKFHNYVLVAEIRKINHASQKIFKSIGFQIIKSDKTFEVLHYDYNLGTD